MDKALDLMEIIVSEETHTCVMEFQVIRRFKGKTQHGMGMMNDSLALSRVVRDSSLKR